MTNWLVKNYPNIKTRYNFTFALKNWVQCFYGKESLTEFEYPPNSFGKDKRVVKKAQMIWITEIDEGIERYLGELENRDFIEDLKSFLNWLRKEGYASLTIRMIFNKVKVFFTRNDSRCKISDEDWANIKRTLLPKSTRAATQDNILTKDQLKTVLQHLGILGSAITLFLLSTSVRISEALQLKMSDITLDSDPPEVNIREEYTKGEVGGRVMWFSEEARDAIIEWHKVRPFKKKAGGFGSYDIDKVFNTSKNGFEKMWNRALREADGGRVPPVLAKRDPSTRKRIHVYHVHTLRKFFRTNIGLAGVPDMVVHAWMGHKPYLSTYDKLGKRRMAEIYKDHMDIVTVYGVDIDEKARIKYKETVEKAEKLAKQTIEDNAFIDMIGGQLDVPANLSVEEKKNIIIYKIAQIKVDLARAREKSIDELKKAMEQMSMIPSLEKAGGRVKAT